MKGTWEGRTERLCDLRDPDSKDRILHLEKVRLAPKLAVFRVLDENEDGLISKNDKQRSWQDCVIQHHT